VLAALVALALTSPADAAASAPCRPAGATTIVQTQVARVYRAGRPRRVYGCLFRSGRVTPITTRRPVDTRLTDVKPRVAGRFVAFAYTWDSGAAGGDGLAVVNLATGKKRDIVLDPSTRPDPEDVIVHDMVLTSRGSLAWIWNVVAVVGQDEPGVREVRKLERDADVRRRGVKLDEGAEVEPASLERAGTDVTWLKAGALLTAPLL